MAMGGAFVAVADDVSTVYWNPAGVSLLEPARAGFTVTLNNRYSYNYDAFAAVAGRVSDTWGVGVSWVLSTLGAGGSLVARDDWAVVSIGGEVGGGLSAGGNFRLERHGIEGGSGLIAPSLGVKVDIGVLYQYRPWLSLGLLVQDFSAGPDAITNIRPGLAVRPNDTTVIALDAYDLAETGNRVTGRFGVEKWVTDGLAIRAGYYGFRLFDTPGAVTGGLGLKVGRVSLDYAFLGGRLGNTHQLGLEVAF
ncbi:MAG: hypothetical protein NUW23_00875 [Firmicutes bacterium]|nr:hypothetical protein [Bacillota bacterium]